MIKTKQLILTEDHRLYIEQHYSIGERHGKLLPERIPA